jgi:hypothetical protein
LGSVRTTYERCTLEIKSGEKQHSIRIRLFTRKLDLNIGKKLVNFYVMSIAVYGAETWTLRETDHNLKVLKFCAGEG